LCPALCRCNFEYENSSGGTDTLDWEGKINPGDCILLQLSAKAVKVAEGPEVPWDFGYYEKA
jgi:hypothetical protein